MDEQQARAVVHGWEQAVHATLERFQAAMKSPPPSHEELLRRYQFADDERGTVLVFGSFGHTVTADERDALWNLWPWELSHYRLLTEDAIAQAPEVFPDVGREGHGDNHRDAFRHAYWNSQLVDTLGAEKAEELATLHEGRGDNEPREHATEAMDLYNNEVGRQLAQEYPDVTAAEMRLLVQQAVREGRMVVLDDTGRLVPSDYDFKPR